MFFAGAPMSSAEVWKSWEGKILEGKFPLQQLVGGSEHSSVFLTELPGTNQRAALKLIPADAGDADRQLVRWRAAAQLSHPHLMRIFESGRSGQTLLYIVTEFAEDDVSQVLPQRALEANEVRELLPPLLEALSYLHSKGFVHGRTKPSNILAVGEQLKLSSDHVSLPSEMNLSRRRRDVFDAPELAAGIVSPAADMWSLGVTLVTALTQNSSSVEDGQGGPRLPESMPEPFRSIAKDCLNLDPKRRCTIADVRSRLRPASSAPAAAASPAEPQVGRETPAPANRRGPIAAMVLVAALVIGLGIFYFRGNTGATPTTTTATQPAPQPTAPSTPTTNSNPAPAAATPAAAAKPSPSKGEVVHQVLPNISKSARNTITGTIKIGVRVQVDANGKVTSAKLSPAAQSAYFNRLVLQAAEQWEFSAPNADGQAQPSTWLLQFRLRRGGTQVVPQRINR